MTEAELAEDRAARERWNGAHIAHHPGALSGSDPAEVLDHHRVSHLVRPGLVFLDIGVGLGGMAGFMSGRGVIVDCLDVADAAEQTVRPFCRRFWLAERIEELPSAEYDLAVSMLVAQHQCERQLRTQIRHVGRALKPGGLFSLHLAGSHDPALNNLTGPIPSGMDGAMCRDPWYSLGIIGEELPVGFAISLLDRRMDWLQFKSYWYWVHIRRNGA